MWEWTSSVYVEDYGGDEKRYARASSSGQRVLRGGSWGSGPRGVRSANRNGDTPDYQYSLVGFRLAQD